MIFFWQLGLAAWLSKNIQATVIKETPDGSIAKEVPIDKLGIDDENFLEIAEEIFNEKLALMDKFNDEGSDV